MGKNLTWEQIGKIYKRETGHSPFIISFDKLIAWVKKRKDLFIINKDSTISRRK